MRRATWLWGAALVAPVRVGRRAVVAAGTTVTRDVPAAALALSRTPQIDKLGDAQPGRQRYERRPPQPRRAAH